MVLEYWEELTPKISKCIGKFPIIQYSPSHWWVLNIVDVFGPHTYSLKSMETYEKYKFLMLKEEDNTSNFYQSYEQYFSNQDKSSLKEETYVLRFWITATRDVLNYWFLFNVGLQYVKKLPK